MQGVQMIHSFRTATILNANLALLIALLVGCDGQDAGISRGGSESQAGSGSGDIAVTEARKHLFKTAEKLEGPFVRVVREYVGAYEIGDWSIGMLTPRCRREDGLLKQGRHTAITVRRS